jgi:hypothetical protein
MEFLDGLPFGQLLRFEICPSQALWVAYGRVAVRLPRPLSRALGDETKRAKTIISP